MGATEERTRRRRQPVDPVTRLVEDHIHLVGQEVRRASSSWPRHVDIGELEAAGRLGLLDAARRFDDARSVPFASYAKLRIRGAILDALRDMDWVPRGVRNTARELDRSAASLTARLGRVPTEDELVAETGLGLDELRRSRDQIANSAMVRIDEDGGGPGPALAELLLCPATGAEQRIEDLEMRAVLGGALAALGEREREVICGIYLEGRPQAEIAVDLGVSESRISQIHHITLQVLGEMLADYLPGRASSRPEPGTLVARERRAKSSTEAISRYRNWYREQRNLIAA
jgi:RNA polymerase sigma factor for flagellar operon FliA